MMLVRLRRLLAVTLRRQLIVGMALIVASMMSLFVWDMTRRQQSVALEQQSEHAAALARSVSASAAVWVASRDFSGLQEIVQGLALYPDLRHAIVLDLKGLVLAHSEPGRRGLYLSDLPQETAPKVLQRSASLVDVASPVMLGGSHIGWVRIGLARDSLDARLAQVTRSGLYYALMAIVLSIFFSALAGRYLTRRLFAIQHVADAVRSGVLGLRAVLSGNDEAAQLARQFNNMLDTLAQREEALRESQADLHEAQRIAHVGSWQLDMQSGKLIWSEEVFRIFEIDSTQFAATFQGFLNAVHPDDRDAVNQSYADSLRERRPYEITHRLLMSDGRIKWVNERCLSFFDATGKPTHSHGIVQDITERKQMEDQVRQLAFFDSLTQLPNRRLLTDRLSQAMVASKRSACYGALIFLDLDNFKSLNDTQGHEAGDLLLIEAAGRLKSCVRATDTVARFGGDEFVVMLGELDAEKAESTAQTEIVAEKIRKTLSEPYLLTIRHDGKANITIEHHCTASIGVALFIGYEADLGDILKQADRAMYQAKGAGRNLVRFHDPEE